MICIYVDESNSRIVHSHPCTESASQKGSIPPCMLPEASSWLSTSAEALQEEVILRLSSRLSLVPDASQCEAVWTPNMRARTTLHSRGALRRSRSWQSGTNTSEVIVRYIA
nr:hypothetical protein CFP56_03230 [Quercus suber]